MGKDYGLYLCLFSGSLERVSQHAYSAWVIDGPRVWLSFGKNALPAHELVAWLGARYRLKDVTFQEPEIEDVIRRIYEEDLLRQEVEVF